MKSFLLSDPDLQSFHNKSNSILSKKGTLLELLQAESKKVKKKTDDLLTLRLEGDMSKELSPIHYKPLEERHLKIQQLSSDTVQFDAKNLFGQWDELPFEEKRTIVETLTDHIIVDKEDIAIKLSYIPILPIVIGGKAQRILIPAFPFSRTSKLAQKPLKGYPKEVVSVGDHIRAKRLRLKLWQVDLAKILQVSTETITNWETGRSNPNIKYYPAIIQFLGYIPFTLDLSTVGNKVKYYRIVNGLSHRNMGKLVNRDASTIVSWENANLVPNEASLLLLKKLFADLV